ncbi:MAG: GAF domain-containing protein [Chitinophagales bacterium]
MTNTYDSLRETQWTNELLELLLCEPTPQSYLEQVLGKLVRWTGCRAIGIRVLRADGSLPYEVHVGFGHEFWQSENHISVCTDNCACTRVITGRPEAQDLPVMTLAGSFHCSDMERFASRLTPDELARFRGKCIAAGFKTVTVVPIRHEGQAVGVIHLADPEPDKLPPRMVDFLESVAPLIGEAYTGLLWKE